MQDTRISGNESVVPIIPRNNVFQVFHCPLSTYDTLGTIKSPTKHFC